MGARRGTRFTGQSRGGDAREVTTGSGTEKTEESKSPTSLVREPVRGASVPSLLPVSSSLPKEGCSQGEVSHRH